MSWWGANIFTHDLNHPPITEICFVRNFEHVLFVFWSNTHCWELMNLVGIVAASHYRSRWRWCSDTLWRRPTRLLPQPFLGLFWFDSNKCSIWPVSFHLFVEFSRQSHWHAHSKSRLGLRVWGARSSLWSDNVPSFHHANKYSSWFFHCKHGNLECSFQSLMWFHLIFHYSKDSPFLCFWLPTLRFGLVCVFMSW